MTTATTLTDLGRLLDHPAHGLLGYAQEHDEILAYARAARALRLGGGERIHVGGLSTPVANAILTAMELDPDCDRAAYDLVDACRRALLHHLRHLGPFTATVRAADWTAWAQRVLGV